MHLWSLFCGLYLQTWHLRTLVKSIINIGLCKSLQIIWCSLYTTVFIHLKTDIPKMLSVLLSTLVFIQKNMLIEGLVAITEPKFCGRDYYYPEFHVRSLHNSWFLPQDPHSLALISYLFSNFWLSVFHILKVGLQNTTCYS